MYSKVTNRKPSPLRTALIMGAALAGSLMMVSGPALGDAPRPRSAPVKAVDVTELELATPTLREFVSVEDKVVRLDDVFANAGEYGDRVLMRAPAPGQRVHFDYRWLARVARAYRLDWQPMTRHDKVTIERAGHVLPVEEIEASLLAALPADVASPDMEVEISNRRLRLYVPMESLATVRVDDFSYSPRSQRFNAVIAAPADDPGAPRYRIAGRVHHTLDVPVPVHRLNTRDIISERDVQWMRVRSGGLQHDIITDVEQLVGQSPRRMLRAGQPVRTADVQAPLLVQRGSQVTMVLTIGNMRLTATGKALQNGAEGDVIRVANSQSNQTIEATVTGAGKVTVLPTTQLASR